MKVINCLTIVRYKYYQDTSRHVNALVNGIEQ